MVAGQLIKKTSQGIPIKKREPKVFSTIEQTNQTNRILMEGGRKVEQQPTPEQVQAEAGITPQPTTQPQTAPVTQAAQVQQPQLSTLQQASKLGLAVPVAAGNAITSVLEKVTGKKFGRSSTTELAQTGAGEALGLGIDVTGLAAGGLYAYESYLASLSASELIGISAENTLPSAIRLPATHAFTKLTTGKILSGYVVGHVPSTMIKDSKQAIVSQQVAISNVLDDVKTRGKSYAEAQQDFNQIESDINELAGAVHFWGKLDYKHWLGKGKDDEVDIKNTRKTLEQARFDLLGVATQAATERLKTKK